MDLSRLSTREKSEEGQVLTIVDPVSDLPFKGFNDEVVTITLKGSDCREFKAMQYRQSDKAFKGGKLKMSSEQLATEAIKTMAKMTISWTGISFDNESLAPCNEANAVKLYTDYEPVKKQVDDFINDQEKWLGNA